MSNVSSLIRNISDTARWSAVYRARESERHDALFKDPMARRLAGERGEQIAASLTFTDRNAWSWVTRTVLFDQFIAERIEGGADMVINLAAGLDTRPYRMDLPASLRWVEIDLPEILAYKEDILREERPACSVERLAVDLSDSAARCEIFARLVGQAKSALVVSEGFLIYLSPEQVASLAADLARVNNFHHWAVDLASPGLLRLMQKHVSNQLPGDSTFRFAPAEGPGFFTTCGWRPIDVRPLLKTAAQLHRLSLGMRLLSLLPASNGPQGSRPWAAVCLLARDQ